MKSEVGFKKAVEVAATKTPQPIDPGIPSTATTNKGAAPQSGANRTDTWHNEMAARRDAAEQQFIENLMRFMRSAKRSPVKEVAAVARDWEGKIVFRVMVEKQARAKREGGRQRAAGGELRKAA